MSRKLPAKGTGPAPATLREQDPQLARERAKYPDPLPSREFILSLIETAGVPVEASDLEQRLDIRPGERESFARRLAAMERDGQLIRNRRNALCLPSKLDLIKARVEGHPDGFGFAVPEDGTPDLFLGPKEMQKALHGDTVLVRAGGLDRRGRREGYIAEVLVRANTRLVARLHREHGVLFAVAENRRISQDFLVAPGQDLDAQPGQVVMVELLAQPSRHAEPIARVVEIVGNYADPGMEVEIALRKHALPHEFPPAALAQAARLPAKVTRRDLAGRVDVRNLPLVTIDGETARDFDDAVFCAPEGRGFRLMVAIADVSHYVRPGDALDTEALSRGNSVYFPRRVIPMLPEELSNGLCSLNPDVDRLCMLCEMTISAAGEISRYRFYPAVMHSHARFTYTEVAAILARPAAAAPHRQALVPHLRMLDKVYRAFFKARSARGAIDFATVETQLVFDDQGKIDRVEPVERNDAHRIIEECMLAANVCASDYLTAHKHPTLFRIHPGPTPEKLEAVRQFLGEVGLHLGGGSEPRARDYAELIDKIQGRPDRDLLQTVLLRSLQQARYSPDNVGHFGLAYDAYAHFTSPIRRYPDLLVHRAIRAVLAGETYKPGSWADIGMHCSGTERRADEATRDVEQWLKCWFMRDRIQEEFDGTVSAVVHFGLFVMLDGVHVEGLIHISELGQDYYHHDAARHQLLGERSGKRWRLGDRIRVRVVRVDLETTRIDFVPAPQAALAPTAMVTTAGVAAVAKPGRRGKARPAAVTGTTPAAVADTPATAGAAAAAPATSPRGGGAQAAPAAAGAAAEPAPPAGRTRKRGKSAQGAVQDGGQAAVGTPQAVAMPPAAAAAAPATPAGPPLAAPLATEATAPAPLATPVTDEAEPEAAPAKPRRSRRGRRKDAADGDEATPATAVALTADLPGSAGPVAGAVPATPAAAVATPAAEARLDADQGQAAGNPDGARKRGSRSRSRGRSADRADAPGQDAPVAPSEAAASPTPAAVPKARAEAKPAAAPKARGDAKPAAAPKARAEAKPAATPRAKAAAKPSAAPGTEAGARSPATAPGKAGAKPARVPKARDGAKPAKDATAKAAPRSAPARKGKADPQPAPRQRAGARDSAGSTGKRSSAPRAPMVPLVTPLTPLFLQAQGSASAKPAPAAAAGTVPPAPVDASATAPARSGPGGGRAPRRRDKGGGDGPA